MSNENVDQFGRADREPRDRYHPKYESFSEWLDAEAPPDQAQKLRNRSAFRSKRKTKQTRGASIHLAESPANE